MNEYDKTKKMLNISRKGVIRQMLKEDDGTYYDKNKESKRELSEAELEQEKKEFAANVTKLSNFNDFKVSYDNVTWGGFLPQEKIEWVYSLETDDGVYISCELTQLTQGTLELVQKLYGYYKKWADKWKGEIGVKSENKQEPIGQQGGLGMGETGSEVAPGPPPQV